jgi:hypothetical protein
MTKAHPVTDAPFVVFGSVRKAVTSSSFMYHCVHIHTSTTPKKFVMNTAATLFVLILSSLTALASGSGITGRTNQGTFSSGCATCHGGAPNTATEIRVLQAVDGKVAVKPGETVELSVVVAHPTNNRAGVNIAVKRTENGALNVGQLTAVAGLRALAGSQELTHIGPRQMSGGQAVFTFRWTAPQDEGTYFLQAVGNAVNGNSSADGGDAWNYLTPVQLVVSNPTSVEDRRTQLAGRMSPIPAHDNVTLSAPASDGEVFAVTIASVDGIIIATDAVTATSGQVVYTWNGRNSQGLPVAPGSYSVALFADRRTIRGTAIISR